MQGDAVVVSTMAGPVMGVITEETTEERWIRSARGFLVQQKRYGEKWETVATSSPCCFFADHDSIER